MRYLILVLALVCVIGCPSAEEIRAGKSRREEQVAAEKAKQEEARGEKLRKLESIKTKKILNIREGSDCFDFVMEDGEIITFHLYSYTQGKDRDARAFTTVGIK